MCAILRGVIAGMAFLHETMGIAHGDLKPLNMLLHAGEVKLCDFGSSQLLQHDISELAFSATLPYMAPELLSHRPRDAPPPPGGMSDMLAGRAGGGSGLGSETLLDSRGSFGEGSGHGARLPSAVAMGPSTAIDVYSFGVCLWEMCERVYPWHVLLEAGRVEELKKRVGRRAERLDATRCPLAFRLILEACWRQEPHKRPTFGQLATIDLPAIGRGAAQAVRDCRALLWPDGTPSEWAGEQLDDEGPTESLESFGSEPLSAEGSAEG